MKGLTSVIIPTYNRAVEVERAIRSVLGQENNGKIEIIVCDDGSTDKTNLVIKKLAKSYSNIRYIKLSHSGGPAKPRNRGIDVAKGEWIAFLDSDDTWINDKLQKQLDFAREYHLDFVSSNAIRLTKTEKQVYFAGGVDWEGSTYSKLLKENHIICSTVLVKKSTITSVGGFPEAKKFIAIEDYACWLKIALETKIGYLSKPLIIYADNSNKTIRRKWSDNHEQYKTIIPYIFSWYSANLKLTYRYVTAFIPLVIAYYKHK